MRPVRPSVGARDPLGRSLCHHQRIAEACCTTRELGRNLADCYAPNTIGADHSTSDLGSSRRPNLRSGPRTTRRGCVAQPPLCVVARRLLTQGVLAEADPAATLDSRGP